MFINFIEHGMFVINIVHKLNCAKHVVINNIVHKLVL